MTRLFHLLPACVLSAFAIFICTSQNLRASPLQATFDGVNGTADFGYYVGPYFGKLEGKAVTFYCEDFANEVSIGQSWLANLSTITSGSDLSATRYGSSADALALYQEAAWLTTQYVNQPTSEYGNIQATIWQLFDPAAPSPSSNIWLDRAKDSYQSIAFGDFRVVTNTGPVQPTGQVQEFLINQASPVGVPEPVTVILMGSGLLGMLSLWRRSEIQKTHDSVCIQTDPNCPKVSSR